MTLKLMQINILCWSSLDPKCKRVCGSSLAAAESRFRNYWGLVKLEEQATLNSLRVFLSSVMALAGSIGLELGIVDGHGY